MDVSRVLKSFEDYYGKYPRVAIRVFVKKYLVNFTEEELSMLHDRVILNVTTNRFTIPDVATIDGVKKQINQERANERLPAIGKAFLMKRQPSKTCKKCGKPYIGTACMKCGWSETDEENHGTV